MVSLFLFFLCNVTPPPHQIPFLCQSRANPAFISQIFTFFLKLFQKNQKKKVKLTFQSNRIYFFKINSHLVLAMLNDEDIDRILSELLHTHGYDFTFYSRESLKRRLNKLYRLEKYSSPEVYLHKIHNDPSYIEHLVNRITVSVTEMFRDAEFFAELRSKVLPELAHRKQIKIWHAGCSSGEEVYSMAILLQEAGLLERSTLYGTDINRRVLDKAGQGAYPLSLLRLYENKYLASGGQHSLTDYYKPQGEQGVFHHSIRKHMLFSEHNLATHTGIEQTDLILCRNVVIYFDRELQRRVIELFDHCLLADSFLALGEKESIAVSSIAKTYQSLGKQKIWKK